MISKKKGTLCAMICLVAILLSVFINPTVSRYVLEGFGTILKSVITSPPISVTFVDSGQTIHTDEALSHGMKLIRLNQSYNSYTTFSENLGENTASFANSLVCPVYRESQAECGHGGVIGIVNSGSANEYIGCACGVEFEGWMNATGNVPNEVMVLRDFVLNAKWNIPDKYHLSFIDANGNMVLQKQFTSSNRTVNISSTEATTLSNSATTVGAALTDESDGAFKVTASWENYATAGNHTMLNAEDVIVNMNLTFAPPTESDVSVTLEAHRDPVTNEIIDKNGDGFPDSYKVVGGAQTPENIDIKIPEYILGSPITEVAGNSFAGFSDLRDVHIPSTITKIGADAFTQYDTGWGAEYPQIQLIYDGTREQWNALEKDPNWDRNIGTNSNIIFLQEPTVGYENLSGRISIFGNKTASWEWTAGSYPGWFTERYPDLVEYANSFHQ